MDSKHKKIYKIFAQMDLDAAIEGAYNLGKIDGKLEQLYEIHPELKEKHEHCESRRDSNDCERTNSK